MFKTLVFASLLLIAVAATAQVKQAVKKDSVQKAIVEVSIKDSKDKARKGEEIVIVAKKSKKSYTGISNANGFFSMNLPAGDEYNVFIKAVTDSNIYGNLVIAALGEGEFYDSPFKVDIVYDPPSSYTLHNVEFDNAKYSLRPASYKELNQLVAYMQRKDVDIEIAGHTDNVGNADDNQKLSQQRAEAVKNYLISKGIAAKRLVAKGYGSSRPIADNATDEGRQRNRRTEVNFFEK